MKKLTVPLANNPYPIFIGENLLSDAALFSKHISGNQVLIVSNATVAALYLEKIQNVCHAYQSDVILLLEGERFKTLEEVSKVFDTLLEKGHHRTTTLIALGGGVIGDMAGFAAACYQRGVNFIQVPTTLLAQVDSSVGGKTGVNHPLGKNMIGAFFQPSSVIIDITTLATLPKREFHAGLAEVIKYGLLGDADFFAWLEAHLDELLAQQSDALEYAIYHACRMKADIVAADEKETGERALLNLGHTFGHAIESATGYSEWLHGEAIAVGLVLAARLSVRLGLLDPTAVPRIQTLLTRSGLPTGLPQNIKPTKLLELMQRDKKVVNKKLRFVLLESIGHAVLRDDVSADLLMEICHDNDKQS